MSLDPKTLKPGERVAVRLHKSGRLVEAAFIQNDAGTPTVRILDPSIPSDYVDEKWGSYDRSVVKELGLDGKEIAYYCLDEDDALEKPTFQPGERVLYEGNPATVIASGSRYSSYPIVRYDAGHYGCPTMGHDSLRPDDKLVAEKLGFTNKNEGLYCYSDHLCIDPERMNYPQAAKEAKQQETAASTQALVIDWHAMALGTRVSLQYRTAKVPKTLNATFIGFAANKETMFAFDEPYSDVNGHSYPLNESTHEDWRPKELVENAQKFGFDKNASVFMQESVVSIVEIHKPKATDPTVSAPATTPTPYVIGDRYNLAIEAYGNGGRVAHNIGTYIGTRADGGEHVFALDNHSDYGGWDLSSRHKLSDEAKTLAPALHGYVHLDNLVTVGEKLPVVDKSALKKGDKVLLRVDGKKCQVGIVLNHHYAVLVSEGEHPGVGGPLSGDEASICEELGLPNTLELWAYNQAHTKILQVLPPETVLPGVPSLKTMDTMSAPKEKTKKTSTAAKCGDLVILNVKGKSGKNRTIEGRVVNAEDGKLSVAIDVDDIAAADVKKHRPPYGRSEEAWFEYWYVHETDVVVDVEGDISLKKIKKRFREGAPSHSFQVGDIVDVKINSKKRRGVVVHQQDGFSDQLVVCFDKPYSALDNEDWADNWVCKQIAAKYGRTLTKKTAYDNFPAHDVFLVSREKTPSVVALSTPQAGDKVRLTFKDEASSTGSTTCTGIVVDLSNDRGPCVMLLNHSLPIEGELDTKEQQIEYEAAKKLGYHLTLNNAWWCEDDAIVHEVTEKRRLEEDVLPGDRIEVEWKGKWVKSGTVITSPIDGAIGMVVDEVSFTGRPLTIEQREEADRIGCSTSGSRFFDWFKRDATCKITKILPSIELKDVVVGDKVRVRVKWETTTRIMTGVVVATDDNQPIVLLDSVLPNNPTWEEYSHEDGETPFLDQAAYQLGLAPVAGCFVCLTATDWTTSGLPEVEVVAKIGKHEYDWKEHLVPGERVDSFDGPATIIAIVDGVGNRYKLCLDKDHSPLSIPSGFTDKASAFGLTLTESNWEGAQALHLKSKLPPLDISTLNDGDRITVRVQYDGKVEVVLGTVVTHRNGPTWEDWVGFVADKPNDVIALSDDGVDKNLIDEFMAEVNNRCKLLGIAADVSTRNFTEIHAAGMSKGKPYCIEPLQVVGKFQPAPKEGDRVEIEHSADGEKKVISARVLDTASGVAILVGAVAGMAGAFALAPEQKEKAKSLGEDDATHGVILDQQRILKVESMTIAKESLRIGDKLKFEVDDEEFDGVVVLTSAQSSSDEPIIWVKQDSCGEAWSTNYDDDLTIIQYFTDKLKLKGDRFVGFDQPEVAIKSIVERSEKFKEVKQEDLKDGDRIVLITESGEVATATLVDSEAPDPFLWFDAVDNGLGWPIEEDDEVVSAASRRKAKKLGITLTDDDDKGYHLTDGCTILEKLEPLKRPVNPPLDHTDLKKGDRVELRLFYYRNGRKISKKVLGTYLCEGYVQLDSYTTNGRGSKSFAYDEDVQSEELLATIKELNFDPEEKRTWLIDDTDTEIIRIVQGQTGDSPQTKEEETMSNTTNTADKPSTFVERTKSEMKEAGYRIASDKMIDGFTGLLVLGLEKKLGDSEKAQAVSLFLSTEAGKAMMKLLIGNAVPMIPGDIAKDQRIQKIAGEMRVQGLTTVGGELLSIVSDSVTPILKDAISALPAEEDSVEPARVKAPASRQDDHHEEQRSNNSAVLGRN